ncbi:YdcF family protein [Polynucleobacter sp. MWH-UH24A]|uniref:YdcF family protein n=1 Tax=Polynucleobacter sp. MWH-UH24A TaxID=2689110 RepID=UPI001BFD2563|nr:YdcF family protein [Polynucleobacter sp. MWH-UH24A]QWD76332.1 YdcF family protein [Polynucleobacter sp. MWH-UH24A]
MDSLFFITSKIVQFVIEPLNLIFLVTLLGWFFLIIRKTVLTNRLLALAVIGFLAVGYLPIPEALTRVLEDAVSKSSIQNINPDQFAGIIILGGAISGEDIASDRGEVSIGSAAERVTKGLELIRKYPDKPFIFSGFSGRVNPRGMSEADAFKQLIQEQGLGDITNTTAFYENQSRNTYENAIYSKMIMDTIYQQSPVQQAKPWLLVTSASHMYRSTKIFEKQGIPIIAVPVDYQTANTLQWREFNLTGGAFLWNMLLHEYIGIAAYQLTGKISLF